MIWGISGIPGVHRGVPEEVWGSARGKDLRGAEQHAGLQQPQEGTQTSVNTALINTAPNTATAAASSQREHFCGIVL